MQASQSISIPQQLIKHSGFLVQISLSNDKVYSHIQYLKYLVESMYDLYHKMSKASIKLAEEYEKKLSKMNDSTALAILNFIKGIAKLFQNIREQISNNTVNLSKKNQKVSRTRKQIVNEKLAKINILYTTYLQKVQKYNKKQEEYQEKCTHFKNIDQDVLKFYSTKDNKILFEELQKKQVTLQQLLEETYSIKMELKSGLNEIRISLKEFFEMLSNNADDDKRLLMSVRKKLKETKIFNETIIEEVNSEAEESVKPQREDRLSRMKRHNMSNNNDLTQRESISPGTERDEPQWSFPQLSDNMTIQDDIKDIAKNINHEEYSISMFCEFVNMFEKEIIANGDTIDKLRNTQDFQKFIDKKFEINELLTSDMINNTQAIKHEIADIRQILEGIKGLLNKKKVINELQKYRGIKFDKFVGQTQIFVELEKKQQSHTGDLRRKYKEQKQKFAKGHLELMRRFRQMVQDMFRDTSEEFKFQRNTDFEFKKVKNQFIKKKYYSLLMLAFFVNKEDTPKFQLNPFIKVYEKYMTQENLKKVGLADNPRNSPERNRNKSKQKGWLCCGISLASNKSQRSKYIDEYNCALRNRIVLIQGKMKIHQNYLKFISSFNAKTFLGQTNLRVPKGEIQSFERKYVLLSLVLVVNTVHGELSFTSFLTDPYDKLIQAYENKEPTRRTVTRKQLQVPEKAQERRYEQKATEKTSNQTFIVSQNCKSPSNYSGNFITELEEKFQSQIPEYIDKAVVNLESLSTYLSESKKQLSVSVQYDLVEDKEKRYFFQIKIVDRNSKLQYKFIHEKSMENQHIKKMLQKMAADIVNSKIDVNSNPKRFPPTIKKISSKNTDEEKQKATALARKQSFSRSHRSSGFRPDSDHIIEGSEYSFIEQKENNQFEFDRDPSFVYVKEPSVSYHGGDPSFNYVPDLQIFKNMESEKKITFGPVHTENMSKSRHSQKSQGSGKRSEKSLSRKEIDEYLNSIEEKEIKKSLKGTRREIGKKESESESGMKQGPEVGMSLNMKYLIVMVVGVMGVNLIVSMLK